MIANIFSCGPSVLVTHTRAPEGLRIGINLAPKHVPNLDWLVFGDQLIVDLLLSQGMPSPAVGVCAPFDLAVAAMRSGVDFMPWEALDPPEDPGYSANMALYAATHLGATEIHLFGFDHRGTRYADGTEVAPTATPRWEREGRMFATAQAYLTRRGVRFTHH